MGEKNKQTDDIVFVLSIFANLFFPGLGNIICGQTKFGIIVLLCSLFLTIFYFLPLVMFLPTDLIEGLWVLIIIVVCMAWIMDIALVVISIIKLLNIKESK